MNKEYLFLFGFLSELTGDLRDLQIWVSLVRSRAKNRAPEFSDAAFQEIEARLQSFQKTCIRAQQVAEELYLMEDD